MGINKNYWSKELDYPYSPSRENFLIYKNNLINGTTLLLGCTHKLINLSNVQLDIDPWYNAKTVRIGNWIDNKDFYDNIIGDGVFNFTKELTDKTLLMSSKNCKKLIIRAFKEKLPKMKIANYFPSIENFLIKPNKYIDFDRYYFLIWNF